MLKAIAQFVASRTGFTLGAKLQFGTWGPAAPDRAVLIAFNAGGRVYFSLTDRNDQQVQVLCRAPREYYLQAYDDAMTAYNALHGQAGWTLPVTVSGVGWIAQTIEAVAPPQYIGTDSQGRHQWSVNFTFRMKKV